MFSEHDTFHFFSLQYYYLNHAVMYGAIPQWIPFLTHGLIASQFYALQSGLLQNVFMLIAPVFKPFNFLNIFYASMFIDELFLLAGSWLLAKRYFKSVYTVFFVCISVIGSAIWAYQPWFNFRFYYAIPLILFFFHTFLDTGRWRYFVLGMNLIAIQTLGNLSYLIPFTTAALFVYFLLHFFLNQETVLKQFSQIRFNHSLWIPAFWIAVSFTAVYAILAFGTDQVLYYGHLRARDGSVALESFMHTRPEMGRFSFFEFMLGILPFNDYTMYTGFISAFMVMWALVTKWDSRKSALILFCAFILFFAYGTFVSIFFYHVWPMMKYFRHIELTMSFCKLFLCFLAGFGFEAFFISQEPSGRIKILFAALALIISAGFSAVMANPDLSGKIFSFFKLDPAFVDFLYRKYEARGLLILAAGLAFSAVLLISLKKKFAAILWFVLMVHSLDLFFYKWQLFYDGSTKLSPKQYQTLQFTKIPFFESRESSYTEREVIFGDEPSKFFEGSNARYWTLFTFLFQDSFNSERQTDQWLKPLDHLIKAYHGQSIHDTEAVPADGFNQREHKLILPNKPSLQKISSLTEDKIQFFSDAHILGSPDEVAGLMTDPQFKGDLLFLNQPGHDPKPFNRPLDSNERLNLDYEVTHFDSNQIQVSVNIPGNQPAWIFYSDVWHPFWKVIVNGKTKTVYKADLAYKAAPLEPGQNNIRFYFESNWISFLHLFFNLHAVFWLLILCLLIAKICVPEGRWGRLKIFALMLKEI